MSPQRSTLTVINQFFKFIPGHLITKLARKHQVDKKSRSFSTTSHVVALMYAQLAHSISLNDVCDSLRNHNGSLGILRGATPPSRNGLSHANKVRDAAMAEELFWTAKEHLEKLHPQFGCKTRPGGKGYKGLPRRFKRTISAVDFSTKSSWWPIALTWPSIGGRRQPPKCTSAWTWEHFFPALFW